MHIKKHLTYATILIVCFTVSVTAIASNGFFKDISDDAWYSEDVKTAINYGLINGKSDDLYCPDDYLTYAEAIKLAACMNQLYTEGEITITSGNPWYAPYLDYCTKKGIVTKEYIYSDYVTRAGYIGIFSKALPDEGLAPINPVPDDSIPDVPSSTEYAYGVYKLYRAGILQGVDKNYNCRPFTKITRAEVAAILTRMMNKDKRLTFNIENNSDICVTMYSADGRTESVPKSKISDWEAVGWYQYPVCYVYAPDGRAELIAQKDVQAWLSVGWYDSLYVTLYKPYGETQTVSLWDIPLWQKYGWYTEPVYLIYTANGDMLVTKSQVENGAVVSIEQAMKIASDFCKTHDPVTDLYAYVGTFCDSIEEVVARLYTPQLLDYNSDFYLIEVNYIDAFEAISVNKQTGEARYCGGGQDYYSGCGWIDF